LDAHDLLLFELRPLTLSFEALKDLGHRCFSRSALLRRRLAERTLAIRARWPVRHRPGDHARDP
jgi:hypothetical protein